ncbi:hypothetical protein TNCV_3671761 [Trichonephila clavipes]|nr:hypothetical protein TNCV_3671761 [Trichonephila clavipes]
MKKFILESQMNMTAGHFNLRGWRSNLKGGIPEDDSSMEENISVLGLEYGIRTQICMLSCKIQLTIEPDKPVSHKKISFGCCSSGFRSDRFYRNRDVDTQVDFTRNVGRNSPR